jgi:hypothetical protein
MRRSDVRIGYWRRSKTARYDADGYARELAAFQQASEFLRQIREARESGARVAVEIPRAPSSAEPSDCSLPNVLDIEMVKRRRAVRHVDGANKLCDRD